MIIKSIRQEYEVIHLSVSTDEYDLFLCRVHDEEKPSKQIIRIKNDVIIPTLITRFLDLSQSREFNDFYESFMSHNSLYVVFEFSDADHLINVLNENDFSLEEKVMIGKSLMEHIILYNIPDFILLDALSVKNVLIDRSFAVAFNYELDRLANEGEPISNSFCKQYVYWIKLIFKQELDNPNIEDVEVFIESIENNDFDRIKIFKGYSEFSETLLLKKDQLEHKRPSLLKRFITRVKHLSKYIKPTITIMVCVAVIVYMIYTTFINPTFSSEGFPLKQIGTMRLSDE